jgi:hypothetical protein
VLQRLQIRVGQLPVIVKTVTVREPLVRVLPNWCPIGPLVVAGATVAEPPLPFGEFLAPLVLLGDVALGAVVEPEAGAGVVLVCPPGFEVEVEVELLTGDEDEPLVEDAEGVVLPAVPGVGAPPEAGEDAADV